MVESSTSSSRKHKTPTTWWIGDVRFDPSSRELSSANSTQRLSPKATAVLSMLAEANGLVCSRADILDRVWPRVTVSEEVLTHAIAELRLAFGDKRSAPAYIETIHKRGYRLKAPASNEVRASAASLDLDLTEYGLCLEAQDCWQRGGALNTAKAVELFSMAVRTNPRSARAHAGLAKALTFSSLYYEPDDEKLRSAEMHCATALARDPTCAEALATRGMLIELRQGLRAASQDFAASLALSPQSRETHFIVGRSCFLNGEYRAAIGILERAAKLWDEDLYSLLVAGKLRLKMGDEGGAQANFRRGARRTENYLQSNIQSYRALQSRANFLWHLGQKAEALALLDKLYAHEDPMPYYTASFLALAGEHGEAMRVLENIVDSGFRHAAFLEHDPDFDTLRRDSRFVRIVRAVGAAL